MESSIQAFTSSDATAISGSVGSEPAIFMQNVEESHSVEVSEKSLNPLIQSVDNNTSSSPADSERKQLFETDNASMTIEFLRARLLSERSISRSAKERAKQLAKKVMELELMLEAESQRQKLSQAAVEKALVELHSAGLHEESAHIDYMIRQVHNEKNKDEKKDDLDSPSKALIEDLTIERASSKRCRELSSQQKAGLTLFEDNQNPERGCDSRGDFHKECSSSGVFAVNGVIPDGLSEDTSTFALAVSPSDRSPKILHLNSAKIIGRSCRVVRSKSIDLTETSTKFKVQGPYDQIEGESNTIGPDFSAKDSHLMEITKENSEAFKKHDLAGHGKGEGAGSGGSHEDHFFQQGDFMHSCSQLPSEEIMKLGLDSNDILVNEALQGQNCNSKQYNQLIAEGVSSKLYPGLHDVDARINIGVKCVSNEVHDAEMRVNTESKNILQHDTKSSSQDKAFEDAKMTATQQQHSETSLQGFHSKKASTIQHEASALNLSNLESLLPDGSLGGPEIDIDNCKQPTPNGSLHGVVPLRAEAQDPLSVNVDIALQTSGYENKPFFSSDSVSNNSDRQICPGESTKSPITGCFGGNLSIQQGNECTSQMQLQSSDLGVSPRSSSLNPRFELKQREEEKLRNFLEEIPSSSNIFAAEQLEKMNQDFSDAYKGAGFNSSLSPDKNIKPCISKEVHDGSIDICLGGSKTLNCSKTQDIRADIESFDVRQKSKEIINCSCGQNIEYNFRQKAENNVSNFQSKVQSFRNNLHVNVTSNASLDTASPSSIVSQSEHLPEALENKKMEKHYCCTSQTQFCADVSCKKAGLQRPRNWSQDQLGCACVHVLDDDKRYRQADDRASCHHSRNCGQFNKDRMPLIRPELCASHLLGCTQVPELTSSGKSIQSHYLHEMVVDNDMGNIASCSNSFLSTSVLELDTNKTGKCLERHINNDHPDYLHKVSPNWNQKDKNSEVTSNEKWKFLKVIPPEGPYDAYPVEHRQSIEVAYSERCRSLSSQFPYEGQMEYNCETNNQIALRSTEPSQGLLPATAYRRQCVELNSSKRNENLHTILAALKLAKEQVKASSDQMQFSSRYANAVQYNLPFSYGARNYSHRYFGSTSERAHLDLLSVREGHALQEREYYHMNNNGYEYHNSLAWDRINSIGSWKYPCHRFTGQFSLTPDFSYVERLNVGKGIQFLPN